MLTEQGVSKSAATAGRVRAEGLPLCFLRHDFFELSPQLLWISGLQLKGGVGHNALQPRLPVGKLAFFGRLIKGRAVQ